jgi:RNA polymerase-binding transcription factor DksA
MSKTKSSWQKELEKRFGKKLAKEMNDSTKCKIHNVEFSECPRCGESICKECLD